MVGSLCINLQGRMASLPTIFLGSLAISSGDP
jgi:hypothetical protein